LSESELLKVRNLILQENESAPFSIGHRCIAKRDPTKHHTQRENNAISDCAVALNIVLRRFIISAERYIFYLHLPDCQSGESNSSRPGLLLDMCIG
jgi:hypothetical protein